MDGQRFDEITKSLASGASRRRVIKGAVGGAVASLAAAFGLGRRRAAAQGCSDYGRVCTYTNCCNDGADCVCYSNRHCRCLCPEGSSFDAAAGGCTCPGGGEPCPDAINAVDGCCSVDTVCISPYPGFAICLPDYYSF